jgi:multimeric flavodoxin WrbA
MEQIILVVLQIVQKQQLNVIVMIKLILEGLKYVNGETEAIRIAQGKYKLPTTIKEGYKALKQELKWQ